MPKPRRKTGDTVSTANVTFPQSAGDTTTANPDRERIAARAYELYLARGGTDGMAMEDWLLAERELKGEGEGPNGDR